MQQKISKLPDVLISQIAAGEVIQRPASIIKELLENSIDAKATCIHVQIRNGGIDEIIVKDNGCGIARDELPLALTRHATSKIQTLYDLENMQTLGFRGEAIAAIASIAFLELSSKPKSDGDDVNFAYKITPDAYQIYNPQNPDALDYQIQATDFDLPHGTMIQVRDIFFRTPARRKFLKTPQTEAQQCFEMVKRLALLHPEIEFKIENLNLNNAKNSKNTNQTLHFTAQTAEARARLVLGIDEVADLKILNFNNNSDNNEKNNENNYLNIEIQGFLSHPHLARARANEQHLIINQRWVRDKNLQHAIRQAYQKLSHGHGQSDYIVYIKVPPKEIDINVHPEKTEVRLLNASNIYGLLYKKVYEALSFSLSTSAEILNSETLLNPELNSELNSTSYTNTNIGKNININTENFNNNFNNNINNAEYLSDLEQLAKLAEHDKNKYPSKNNNLNLNSSLNSPLQLMLENAFQNPKEIQKEIQIQKPTTNNQLLFESPKWPYRKGLEQFNEESQRYCDLGTAILLMDKKYIFAQNAQGLIVVDMHAAHERVLYEQYLKQYQTHQNQQNPNHQNLNDVNNIKTSNHSYTKLLQAQNLLIPLVLAISQNQYEYCQMHTAFFKKLGFEIEFHAEKLEAHVHTLPSIITNRQATTLLNQLFSKLQNHEGDVSYLESEHDLQHQWLAKLACHAALRTHDTPNIAQLNGLLRLMEVTCRNEYCNHGRPTWRSFSVSFFDQLFKHGQ